MKFKLLMKIYPKLKNEILLDYVGEFEMAGSSKVGDQIGQTHIRFRNITDYEAYVNYIDEGYDAEDSIFNGYIYKINTPHVNFVSRGQYGNGCDFNLEIFEYRGKNCYNPSKGYCLVKCISFLTGKDYKEQYLDFIPNEKRRKNCIAKARIQPFCRVNINNLGHFDGTRVSPRSVTDRNIALFLFSNLFCSTWKSEGVSFNQAIEKFKVIFKIVGKYITEENVNSHFKYEFIPKKIESQLTNFFVYGLETRNTDRARPYVFCFHRINKISGRYDRDQTHKDLDK